MTGMVKRNTYLKNRSAIRCMQKLQKRQYERSKDDNMVIGLHEREDGTIKATYYENDVNHVEILKSEAEVNALLQSKNIDIDDEDPRIRVMRWCLPKLEVN